MKIMWNVLKENNQMKPSTQLTISPEQVITQLIKVLKDTLSEEAILDYLTTNGMLIRDIYTLGLLPNTIIKGGKWYVQTIQE